MVSDWETSTLGELAEIVMGQSPKGSECNSDGHGTPLLNGPTEFGSYHPYPTQFTTDPKRFSKKDDLLFCVRGSTTGRMNWSDKEYAIGRGLAAFRHKKGKEFQSFLKGVIDIKLPELLASATGSTFPNVSKNQLNDLEVILPPLPEQKAIAHILGSLDDKIELNRQMNETLEAMAQALFKSWFVDFDPVIDNALAAGNVIPDELFERAEQRKGIEKKDNSEIQDLFPDEFEFTEEMGWIPKGWELISFGEFCDIKKGRNITKSTVSEGYIPVVAGGLKPAYYHNESNVNAPVITVSASGANAGFVNLYYQDIWASDCSYISENMSPFIFTTYSFLKYHQDKVFGLQQGAVQPHVYPKDLSRLNFVDSDESVKIVIEKNLNSYYEKIKFNEAQTEALAKIRDTLLPKLMSGELRIPDAAAWVEEI